MPKIKRPMNELGLWLSTELNRRGLLLSDFASRVGATPQYLCDIMRGNLTGPTMQNWEDKFKAQLEDEDNCTVVNENENVN